MNITLLRGQYIINYSIKEGISSYNLTGLLQDKYGFIWVGTQDGLNRFDGKEFDIFNKLAPQERRILHNHIKAMIINGDSLWVSTASGGVNIIDTKLNKVVKAISPATNRKMSSWIEHMQFDSANENLWMSDFDGIYKYNIKTGNINSWKKNPFSGFETMICRRFVFLNSDHILFSIEDFGFAIFNTSKAVFENLYPFSYFQIPNDGHLIINSMILNNGKIFVGSTNGIFIFKYGTDIKPLQQIFNKHYDEVKNIEVKDLSVFENKIYISSTRGLFIYDENGQLSANIQKRNSLISDEKITGCLVDKNKNLWISSYSGLHLENKADIKYVLKDNFQNEYLKDVSALYSCGKDSLIICTWNGLFFYDRQLNLLNRITYHSQPTYGAYFDLYPLGKYEFIVSSQTGNYQLIKRNGSYILIDSAEVNTKWPVPRDFIFSSFLKINESDCLFGSEFESGIIYSSSNLKLIINRDSKPLSISENSINKIFLAKDSSIWILYDNSIDVLDWRKKKINNVKTGKLPGAPDEKTFFDIAEAKGKIWIATYGGGVLFMDQMTHQWGKITTEKGLCNNSIYTIAKQNEDYIWVSTNIGLSRINTQTLVCNNFFSKDNYLAFSFDERSFLNADSLFFFGGPAGLIEISPGKITEDTAVPIIYFKSISFLKNGERVNYTDIGLNKVAVPYQSPYLEIDLSCINFNSPELNTFYYRLNSSSDWVNLGINNKIRLPNFEPGTYLFNVRAASKNGVYSKVKFLEIFINPPWYQTWWFKVSIFLTTTGIIYAFYRYRIRQIKKQHAIRKNIATDLHDDLGSTLNSVKVFTNLAINGVEQESSLQQVKGNLEQATMGLRDMIWVLDDSLDTVDELVTRLKQYALPVANASGMNTEIKADFDASKKQLTKDEKRNLFLVCKEAINNSIKYSGAREISINIFPEAKKIKIIIADNGKGFDAEKVKKGYGLKNMQYRAAQIKFKVNLETSPGEGTKISITPL